jgi:hypothetical protein
MCEIWKLVTVFLESKRKRARGERVYMRLKPCVRGAVVHTGFRSKKHLLQPAKINSFNKMTKNWESDNREEDLWRADAALPRTRSKQK